MWRVLALAAGLLMALVVATPSARTADEKKIKQAIERGVEYLKRQQKENGEWHYQESGMTSLAALTLLECGVPPNDHQIQKAAMFVRNAAVMEDKTYSISLAIVFLDRLGEEVDVALIEAMAVRLLSGQHGDGGWTYKSGSEMVGKQQDRLNQAVLRRGDGKDIRKAPTIDERRTSADLGPDTKQEIDNILQRGPAAQAPGLGEIVQRPDNSNTQFAVLALWTARRYGIPVEDALNKVEQRFHRSQNGDGGWGYLLLGEQPGVFNANASTASTAAMTCAGLLGLAMQHAVASESTLRTAPKGKDSGDAKRGGDPKRGSGKPPDIDKDPAVKAGFAYLSGALAAGYPKSGPPGIGPTGEVSQPPPGFRGGRPGGRPDQGYQPPAQGGGGPGKGRQPPPQGGQPPAQGGRPPGGYQPSQGIQPPQGGRPGGAGRPGDDDMPLRLPNKDLRQMGRFYYFLWSLERTAVAYGLEKIGGVNWYNWGADYLVADQDRDGSWRGIHGGYGADTCFALLFLRRADLAKDLSASMRNKVNITAELRGGVGFKGKESIKPIRSPFEDGIGPDQAAAKPSPSPTKPPAATANVEPKAAELGAELVNAPASKWGQVLAKLRDGNGSEYTQALAHAISQLDGDLKKKAREALAERLNNFKSTTVAAYLIDDNSELRRAAALACAMKDDMAQVGKLIDLLSDKERTVERAAYAALKELTKKDFGPAADATEEEKAKAIKQWKDWWKSQPEK